MPNPSLSMGKLFGVEIDLHWTFILLMLFTLIISVYYFLILVILFFFVVPHELAHSLVAKSYKVRVKRIILYPLGGGSVIDPNGLTPKKELIISLSGPAVSLIIAAILWIISLYAGSTLGQFFFILALINLVLGAFNLLPWLPLDGGRALRSYLQKKLSFIEATRRAVIYSNITTLIFVIGSTAYVLLNNTYPASYKGPLILLNIAVAFFIYFGAQSELAYAILKERIKKLKVKDAISKEYAIVPAEMEIDKLRNLWKKSEPTQSKPHILLFKTKNAVKVLSNSSIQKALLKGDANKKKIKDFGTKINPISPNAPLIQAIEAMNDDGTNLMYVLTRGKISGILQRQRVDYVVGLHLAEEKHNK